jgi:hypothetical protein
VIDGSSVPGNKEIVSEQGAAGRCKWGQKTNDLRVCFLESAASRGKNRGKSGDRLEAIPRFSGPHWLLIPPEWLTAPSIWRRSLSRVVSEPDDLHSGLLWQSEPESL